MLKQIFTGSNTHKVEIDGIASRVIIHNNRDIIAQSLGKMRGSFGDQVCVN